VIDCFIILYLAKKIAVNGFAIYKIAVPKGPKKSTKETN
jgi:hypothetical protein